MIDTGNGFIEIFTNAEGEHRLGAIRHIALLTDNIDELVDKVKSEGYEVIVEPNDKIIESNPPYHFRTAFRAG